MKKYFVEEESLSSVADAIREKSGISEPLPFPAGFVSAVENIQSGSSVPEEATITVNIKSGVYYKRGYFDENGDFNIAYTNQSGNTDGITEEINVKVGESVCIITIGAGSTSEAAAGVRKYSATGCNVGKTEQIAYNGSANTSSRYTCHTILFVVVTEKEATLTIN